MSLQTPAPPPTTSSEPRSGLLPTLALALASVAVTVLVLGAVSSTARSWWWLIAVAGVVASLIEVAVEGGRSTVAHRSQVAAPPETPDATTFSGVESAIGVDDEVDVTVPSWSPPEGVQDRGSSPVGPASDLAAVGWLCDAVSVPKSSHSDSEAEDAWAAESSRRVAALSDGASSSFMAREWAQTLVATYVDDPLDRFPHGLGRWLALATERWQGGASAGADQWWVGESVQRGSHATLVGLRLTPTTGGGTWDSAAVGDSCVVHLGPSPDGLRRIVAFPIDRADAFDRHPDLLSTAGTDADLPVLRRATGEYRDGDIFLLVSDAIAEWALTRDSSVSGLWEFLVSADQTGFGQLVDRERASGALHDDDTTLVRIRTGSS